MMEAETPSEDGTSLVRCLPVIFFFDRKKKKQSMQTKIPGLVNIQKTMENGDL